MPGYVRCPKCHAALPTVRFARRSTGPSIDPGGTAVRESSSKFPIAPVIIAVVVAGSIAAYFGLRGGGSASKAKPTTTEVTEPGRPSTTRTPTATSGPVSEPNQPGGALPKPPDASEVANKLEQQLKRQRLWATVSVTGDHVDIRSGACNDPSMGAALEPSIHGFKTAGLSKLRCVEQSGAVVFQRDF